MQQPSSGFIVLGVTVMLGLWGAGLLVGNGVKDMKRADRFVTVKGLAEREVKADLASWPIRFKVTGNELIETQQSLEATQQKVLGFLKTQGFDDSALQMRALR